MEEALGEVAEQRKRVRGPDDRDVIGADLDLASLAIGASQGFAAGLGNAHARTREALKSLIALYDALGKTRLIA